MRQTGHHPAQDDWHAWHIELSTIKETKSGRAAMQQRKGQGRGGQGEQQQQEAFY